MLKIFFSVFLTVLLLGTKAYSQDIDSRLLSKYSESDLEKMKNFNTETYSYLVYTLDHGWYITDLPKKKVSENKDRVKEVTIKDIEHINIYALDIEIIENDYQYFRINNGDRMLVVKSADHIKQAWYKTQKQ